MRAFAFVTSVSLVSQAVVPRLAVLPSLSLISCGSSDAFLWVVPVVEGQLVMLLVVEVVMARAFCCSTLFACSYLLSSLVVAPVQALRPRPRVLLVLSLPSSPRA